MNKFVSYHTIANCFNSSYNCIAIYLIIVYLIIVLDQNANHQDSLECLFFSF